jgi:diguanylate cyclase (GGDEF)-like protein
VRSQFGSIIDTSIFAQALEALPDGVLVVDADRRVLYCNSAFARHWCISPDLVQAGNERELLAHAGKQLIDPSQFSEEVERLHPTSASSNDELVFKDGRIFSRRSVPFLQGDTVQARIWIFTDVTDAKNAELDELTCLPNRRAYSRRFPAFAASPELGLVKAVALLDVDNFKQFNDHYGHAAGDAALEQIGRALRAQLRQDKGDLVFRIGGEEFLVALRARSEAKVRELFEAVRSAVEGLAITHERNAPHHAVTVSAGVGWFRGSRDATHVFNRVDSALFQAKSEGRNRVVAIGVD